MRAIFRGLGFIGRAFFALVGLIIVIGVIAAIAGSKSSTPTGPTNSPQLVTKSASEATSTPTTTQEAQPERPQTFTGAGSENLGTISVTSPSTLEWTCRGCLVFGLNGATSDYSATIGIDSSSHSSGVTAVEPGTYKSVSVIADEGETNAGWTIHIHAR
jgi:hypothetical protein